MNYCFEEGWTPALIYGCCVGHHDKYFTLDPQTVDVLQQNVSYFEIIQWWVCFDIGTAQALNPKIIGGFCTLTAFLEPNNGT